jgi:monoamine oxidase
MAFRKMIEAEGHGVLGSFELEKTAQAWQALAEQIERADALGTFTRPK